VPRLNNQQEQPIRKQPRAPETHNKEMMKNTGMHNKETMKNNKSAQQRD
jgi:hypothetical protein